MVILKHFSPAPAQPFSTRTSHFIDREFQFRYVILVLLSGAVGMLVSIGPVYYYLNQNYEIFANLAFENSPALLENLERERSAINTMILSGSLFCLTFFAILSFKMTNRIVGPLKVMRNHLKYLSRGHWSQKPLKVRDADEFHDLVEAYNYFYGSFRWNLHRDLEALRKFNIDPKNRDAFKAWKQMIDEKALQLDIKDEFLQDLKSGPAVKISAAPDSRRAS